MYKIEYLGPALKDMEEIISYISHTLHNPEAAENLAGEFVEKIDSLSEFPYGRPLYYPIRKLAHEYRKLIVRKYTVFYWIEEDNKTVKIARVIFSASDINRKLSE